MKITSVQDRPTINIQIPRLPEGKYPEHLVENMKKAEQEIY